MFIIFKRTRKEAIAAGDLYYFTGKKCKRGHISKRYSGGMCFECLKERRLMNPNYNRKRVEDYHKKNPDKSKIRSLKYRSTDKGRSVANASAAKRRCVKLNATPKWLTDFDKNFIDQMYEVAIFISKKTNIKHHVDHIIPLQGDLVSGLNVANNLQIISQFENCSKGNNYGYI